MTSIAQRIQSFFQEHRELLTQSYPGLNSQRLINEFLVFYQHYITFPDVWNLDSLTVAQSSWERWESALIKGIPLAHVIGEGNFVGMDLWANSSTLIPRPETESLVEMAVNFISSKIKSADHHQLLLRVADVGTGTGAIIIGLAHLSGTSMELTGIDISTEALSLAESNVFKLGFKFGDDCRWNWRLGDRLAQNAGPFDLILSNPPYIKESKKGSVHSQVHQFEPSRALYLPDADYLSWFQKLFTQAYERLVVGGVFIMEGHEDHWDELIDLLEHQLWASVEVQKDLSGRDRFLILKKKG